MSLLVFFYELLVLLFELHQKTLKDKYISNIEQSSIIANHFCKYFADGRADEEHGSGSNGWSEEHTWNGRQEVNNGKGQRDSFSLFLIMLWHCSSKSSVAILINLSWTKTNSYFR